VRNVTILKEKKFPCFEVLRIRKKSRRGGKLGDWFIDVQRVESPKRKGLNQKEKRSGVSSIEKCSKNFEGT